MVIKCLLRVSKSEHSVFYKWPIYQEEYHVTTAIGDSVITQEGKVDISLDALSVTPTIYLPVLDKLAGVPMLHTPIPVSNPLFKETLVNVAHNLTTGVSNLLGEVRSCKVQLSNT